MLTVDHADLSIILVVTIRIDLSNSYISKKYDPEDAQWRHVFIHVNERGEKSDRHKKKTSLILLVVQAVLFINF